MSDTALELFLYYYTSETLFVISFHKNLSITEIIGSLAKNC